MTEDILRGKSKEEITVAFMRQHSISLAHWEDFNSLIKRSKMATTIRKLFTALWGFSLLAFGLTLLITLLIFGMDMNKEFPLIFAGEDVLFYETFINVMFGIFLFVLAIFCCIFPWIKIKATFKWNTML